MKDFYNMHGNPIPGSNEDPEVIRRKQPIRKVARKAAKTAEPEKPEPAPTQTEGLEGSGKKRTNKRAEIVKQIMKEKSLSLIDASKYVKEHNLYQRD